MRSRYFVTDPPVPIYEFDPATTLSNTPPNVIWIRARMDVETSGKVTSDLFTMDKESGLEARVGANQTALLVHNIVKWEGPGFVEQDAEGNPLRDGAGNPIPIPCTPENIRTLDPNEPHIAAVLDEIATRNKKRTSPNPKSAPMPNGSTTAGAASSTSQRPSLASDDNLSLQLATGGPRSSLLSAVDGRLNRSGGSTPTT